LTGSRRSDLDLIVLDLDGGAMLEECLTSIESQTDRPGRVIVWDNGSRVPVAKRIPSGIEVEVFRSETNLGFAGGVNAAFRESEAPFVALVNNDVTLERGWASTLIARLGEDARLAAAQSVILRPDGLVDGAGIDISDGTIRQRGHGWHVARLSGVAWGVSATAVVLRREAVDHVARDGEVFDDRLFAYYEDVELCARLIEAGWSVRVVDEALAVHRGSSTAGTLGRGAQALRVRNRWIVHRMHPSVGRTSSLLAEDLKLVVRALLGLRFREAATRLRAVFDGITTRLA